MESVQAAEPLTPSMCPVTQTLAFVGSRWTPLVIFHLTLADRLQALVEQGLVIRTVHPDTPPRVEYALTERGHRLGDILDSIAEWATA